MKGVFRDIKYLSTSGEGREASSIGCVAGVPGMVERDKLIKKDWNADPYKTRGDYDGYVTIVVPGDVTAEYPIYDWINIQDVNGKVIQAEIGDSIYDDEVTIVKLRFDGDAPIKEGAVYIWRAAWAPIEEHKWWLYGASQRVTGDGVSSCGEYIIAEITKEQYIYIDQAGVDRGHIVLEGDRSADYVAGAKLNGYINSTPITATIESVVYGAGETVITLTGEVVSKWEIGATLLLSAEKSPQPLRCGDKVTFIGPFRHDGSGGITYAYETDLVYAGVMTAYSKSGVATAYFVDIDGNMPAGSYNTTEGVVQIIRKADNGRLRGAETIRQELTRPVTLNISQDGYYGIDFGHPDQRVPMAIGTVVKMRYMVGESAEWDILAQLTGTLKVDEENYYTANIIMGISYDSGRIWADLNGAQMNAEIIQSVPYIGLLAVMGNDTCAGYRDGDILNKLSLSIKSTPSSDKRSISFIEDTFDPVRYGTTISMADVSLAVERDLSAVTNMSSDKYSNIMIYDNMIVLDNPQVIPSDIPIMVGDIIVIRIYVRVNPEEHDALAKIYFKCVESPRINTVDWNTFCIIPVASLNEYTSFYPEFTYHYVRMYPQDTPPEDVLVPPAMSAYEDLTGVTEKFFEGVTYVPRFSIYYDTVFTRTSERGLRTINSVKDIVDIYNQDSLMDPRTNLPMAAYLCALSSGMANKFKIYALDMRGVAEYGVMPNEYADELSSWANMPSQVLPHKDIYGVATMTFSKAVQDMLHAAFVNMSADKMAEKIYFVCRGIINGGDINTQAIDVFGSGQYGMDEYASDRKYSDGDGVVYYDPDADAEAAMSYPLPYNSERLVFVGCEFAGIGDINIEGYYVTAILLGQIMSKPLGYVMDGEGVPLLSRIPMRDTYYSEDDYYDLSISGWYMLEQTGTGPVTHYMGMTTAYSNRDKMELANVIAIDHFMRGIRATLAQYTKGGTENRVDNNGDGTLTKRYMERVSSAVKSVAQDYVNREIFESAALKTAEIDGTVSGRIKIGISISLYRQERYIYVTAYV